MLEDTPQRTRENKEEKAWLCSIHPRDVGGGEATEGFQKKSIGMSKHADIYKSSDWSLSQSWSF